MSDTEHDQTVRSDETPSDRAAAAASQAPVADSVLSGDLTEPLSRDTQSGEADYVATNSGGVSAERGNPLPEDEQGRGTDEDRVRQGPQQEG